MLAVTSPGFVLFAAVLAGLVCLPAAGRWQLMLGASLVFYAVLSGGRCRAAGKRVSGLVVRPSRGGKRHLLRGASRRAAAAGLAQIPARRPGLAGYLSGGAGAWVLHPAAGGLPLRCAPGTHAAGRKIPAAFVLCVVLFCLSPRDLSTATTSSCPSWTALQKGYRPDVARCAAQRVGLLLKSLRWRIAPPRGGGRRVRQPRRL